MPENAAKRQPPSTATRIRIAILSVIQFALLGAALWDLRKRSASQIRGSKWMWTPIVFINFIGPIAYFAFGRTGSSDVDVANT